MTAASFGFSAWLFLRLLALVHLAAFASFWVQLEGLIGPGGLLPATRYFDAVREQAGSTAAAFSQLPSLCWIFGTETFPHVLCAVGVVLALLLFAGIAPVPCLALLWAAYLSLNYAGQIFFHFQWDALLLETTLLALVLAPWRWLPLWQPHEPPRIALWLLRWLLFRLMFFAGYVKLASGDPTWRDLSALTFHYETQPLPTPLGWWAHQLPDTWHRASTAGMFAIELVAPFFLFGPRALRHNAAFLLAALMVAIAFTGNYTFFNLLALALCLLCFDDAAFSRFGLRAWADRWPRLLSSMGRPAVPPPGVARVAALALAVFVLPYTALQCVRAHNLLAPAARYVAPFRSLNTYGLFAVMTRPRHELVFEGSRDGRTWEAYEFPHKPGALDRRPTWVAPHQPRLDWQLWFAALGSPAQNPWVLAVCEHLLRGTPDVLALFGRNPFPAAPPPLVRVVRYEYRFTDPATRAASGHWWSRTPVDFYVQPASLRR